MMTYYSILIIIFIFIFIYLILNKKIIQILKTNETFINCTRNATSTIDGDIPKLNELDANTTILSSSQTNVYGPAQFKKEVVFTKSPSINFDNVVVFDNDIYIKKRKGILFDTDLLVDSTNYKTILNNSEEINDIFSDKYSGEWKNGEYIITDILLDTLDDTNIICSRDHGTNNTNACVSKMWKAVRDGNMGDKNEICNCCCSKEIIQEVFIYARLINHNGNDIILRAFENNPAIYNFKMNEKIDGVVLMTSKKEGYTQRLNVYNVEKKQNDTDKFTGLKKVFSDNKFISNMLMVHPLQRIDNYMPSYIYLATKPNLSSPKQFAISHHKFSDDSLKNYEFGWHDPIMQWIPEFVSPTIYYLKNKLTNEYMSKKHDPSYSRGNFKVGKPIWGYGKKSNNNDDKIFGELEKNGNKSVSFKERCQFRFEFETTFGEFGLYYTGYFWIVHNYSNRVLYVRDREDSRFTNSLFNRNALEQKNKWWYESDEEGISYSMDIASRGIELVMNKQL